MNTLEAAQTNARCVLTSFVHWYAFFWTLNGAALALLYAGEGRPGLSAQVLLTVLFTGLNLSAVVVCIVCWATIERMSRISISAIQNDPTATHSDIEPPVLPPYFLKYVFVTGALSFVANIVAWVLMPFLA